jgi:hypothetical protein
MARISKTINAALICTRPSRHELKLFRSGAATKQKYAFPNSGLAFPTGSGL